MRRDGLVFGPAIPAVFVVLWSSAFTAAVIGADAVPHPASVVVGPLARAVQSVALCAAVGAGLPA